MPMDRSHDKEIWRLAIPAFLALVAEPLFLMADSAIVGHLGTSQLAGLGVAGVMLQTIVGICVFLAYGTTAAVARRIGAGDLGGAIAQGVDGLWLAVIIGVIVTVPGILLARPLSRALGAGDDVVGPAATYLRIALLGVTPLLVMLAPRASCAASKTPARRWSSPSAATRSTSSSTSPWCTAPAWASPARPPGA